MKKILLLAAAFSPLFTQAAVNVPPSKSEALTYSVNETTTYLRCWYRTYDSHDTVATDWKWARDKQGDYYEVTGYWKSSTDTKNMFFTNTSQSELLTRCEDTIDVDYAARDITFFAADNRYSYNHTIWTNDQAMSNAGINKVISFGDSISDTGNLYNASQWLYPNRDSWFLGHFTNGLVWSEYLALNKGLPLYNWAVAGSAGNTQYVVLSGIHDQVESYIAYIDKAQNYDPKNTLFTLEFGLNDFVNFDRSVADVSADFAKALETLIDKGAVNIVTLTLPDASIAPQFKYAEAGEADKVRSKIEEYNVFIKQEIAKYEGTNVNIALYDTYKLLANIVASPTDYGMVNGTDACLDINRSDGSDYLKSHALTDACVQTGSDSFVFWGVTHPTTQVHKLIADAVINESLSKFMFK